MDIEALNCTRATPDGRKAREIGLVDESGPLEQAVSAAAQLVDDEDYSVCYVKPGLSFEEQIFKTLAENTSMGLPKVGNHKISQLATMIWQELDVLTQLNDRAHAYVICLNCPDQYAFKSSGW